MMAKRERKKKGQEKKKEERRTATKSKRVLLRVTKERRLEARNPSRFRSAR